MCALEAPPRPAAIDELDAYFAPRAREVDAGTASIRDGIAVLADAGLFEADLLRSTAVISRVARSDLASAFSAWAHRMVIEYLSGVPAASPLRTLLERLRTGELLGATAMAAGTAHHLIGAPLPVTFRASGEAIVLDGRVPWASNLLPPFVAVTAAVDADDPRRTIVVALTHDTPGLTVEPFPDLLALGATGSSSFVLAGARIPRSHVVAEELGPFVDRVLPPFLLLQSAFCLGLGSAAVESARQATGPMVAVLEREFERLAAGLAAAERRLEAFARRAQAGGPAAVRRSELLRLRLRAAHLASDAVKAELASVGGRGYLRHTATARRLREAAFLPIQSPTEVQLRWILSRSA